MLRRLNVRTRLVAVIAVPLVLLLAVAVPEVLDRRDRAAEAGRAAAITSDVDAVAAATDALQGERTLSAALRAGAGPEVEQALADQRSLSDPAVERGVRALAGLAARDAELVRPVGAARAALDTLGEVRAETDTSASEVPWEDPFAPIVRSLLEVQEAAASVAADLGVGEGLVSVALVARMKDAAAQQGAQMAAATTWGRTPENLAGILSDLRSDEAAYRAAYLTTSPAALRASRRDELLTTEGTAAGRLVDAVVAGGAPGPLGGWLDASDARQQVLREAEAGRAADARSEAGAVRSSSERASRGYLALAGTGLLLALALALAAARSITRPLRELTEAADHLAEDRLPKLVDALRHPVEDDEHYLSAAMEPIAVRSDDELGHLAQAFNTVQSVAVDVAAEQATLLKKGISELYVNLARRNQALLDRQIQHLDQLEREEQDAEVLQHLYLLDHLATRMRRNAESLLVLAGAESGPRRSKPVGVVDVVRAALSEVEEYERVDLGTLAEATLHGPAVSDVAHLVAELLENATQFSPPESAVRVDGARTGGSYQLVISDCGVGMKPEQLEQLNSILRDPPVTGLALGRSLGCLVAARLAARHGITVRLRTTEGEGATAYVVLPRHLLADEADAPLVSPGPAPSESRVPEVLAEALPRADFEAGIQALLDQEGEATVEPEVLASADASTEPDPALVPSGLARRVPGATTEAVPAPPSEPPVRRSPDEVRALLSRYRSGLRAGRGDGPADEERS